MSQPATLACVLALALGAAARAQPPPLARVAKGTRTVFLFEAPVRAKAAEVDPAHIRIVDAGQSTLVIEPLADPGPEERWTLRVPYADAKPPAFAELVLSSHPSEVDTLIHVARPEPSPLEVCEEQVRQLRARGAAMSPAGFVHAGYLDGSGVRTEVIPSRQDRALGILSRSGVAYLAQGWLLADLVIENHSGVPWVPHAATLASVAPASAQVPVRAVKVEPLEEAHSRGVRVLVEADVPPPHAGRQFTLELRGVDGRVFVIPTVRLPPGSGVTSDTKESKR